MDFLFSLLDGACALWFSFFSPRRYLRIVASTKLTGTGARNFFEFYIKMLIVPSIVFGSINQFNTSLYRYKVNAFLSKEDKLLGFPQGDLENLYQPYALELDSVVKLLQSEKVVSVTILFAALVAYYSLKRSREFGQDRRRMRHALQFITTNALTLLAIQIIQVAVRSISLLSIDINSIVIPTYSRDPATVVLQAMQLVNGQVAVSEAILTSVLQVLYLFVGLRVLVFFAKSFRIGFWRSLWLQSRFALPVFLIVFTITFGIGVGLKPINLVTGAVALLLVIGGVLMVTRSARTRSYRRAAPATPHVGRIRVVEGALAGTVVPVSTTIVLGRDPSKAGIVFPAQNTSVSRRHCEIRFDRAAALFEVRDLGSLNGTYIAGGVNIPRRRLLPGVVERVAPGQNVLVGSSHDRLVLELS